VAVLISDTVYFREQKITRDKGRHFVMIKGQLIKKILNTYALGRKL
jgi:hypothetical protein